MAVYMFTVFVTVAHPDTSSMRWSREINTFFFTHFCAFFCRLFVRFRHFLRFLHSAPMLRVQLRLVAVAVMVAIIVVIYYLDSIADKSNLQLQHHFLDALTHFPHLTGPSDTNNQQYMLERAKKLGKEPEGTEAAAQDEARDPCTIVNPHSHGFIDLRGLSLLGNEGRALPWTTKGYDYGRNFTLGICSTPFKKSHNGPREMQDDVNSTLVGGYYMDTKSGRYVSLGEFSTTPVVRGRKLTLKYSNGSYCENLVDRSTGLPVRRSTMITFTCDRDMLAKASISYVGSFDDCNYMFEVRSHHACPTAAKANNLAAVWIFLLIFVAAVLVYFSGDFFYRNIRAQKMQKL